ncbi:outer membrane cobalamin receptor [Parabacteroides sp. PFB2-10]|uniref:TonB-dependent receptor n=1 Tax=Parabacteroides sp. PFB2-10 TaxID=1742405 RepID=UPI00247434C9|nr:TonB-dependent receptor [Parabacteroides sp. PFB2-10]MDH6313262.1 outer membrane cobalamin receptor [Parabacteroides sp. PFB2-10]
MKSIYLLICGIFICSVSSLFAQEPTASLPTVTLDLHQKPLEEILSEVEKQTGLYFSYEASLLNGLPQVNIKAENEPIDACLNRLLTPLSLMWQQRGKSIILKKRPRQVVVSGFVRDKGSSESLIGASVYQIASRKGAATNSYGFFSLSLEPGDIRLQVSYIGYKPRVIEFPFMERDTLLTIELEGSAVLEEVVVVASDLDRQPVMTTQMGKLEINQQTIQATPTMFGESDIIKTIQLTPGVAAGTEGFAGMYVRGGNLDENLFLIDGNPVYQVSHVGGIFSAFNTEAIRGMDFFKAGFPARYGGRLSSVVDVHTKEGNMREYKGSASLGLISANLSLEGPIIKDKTSFMVAMRHTWLDAITAPAVAIVNKMEKKNGTKVGGRYAFYDINMKLNHIFNDRSRMFFSLYHGKDVMKASPKEFNSEREQDDPPYLLENKTSLTWGNLMATLGWTYVFNNKLFGRVSGVFTQYKSTLRSSNEYTYSTPDADDYEYTYNETSSRNGITDFGLRSSFDYLPAAEHHIRFGLDYLAHRFRPEYNRYRAENNLGQESEQINTTFTDDLLLSHEASAFVEDDWTLSSRIKLNGGLRASAFAVQNKTYFSLEPRLSARWLMRRDLSMKASYARMNQFVHLLSGSYINLPTDSWMPVTSHFKPLVSDQVSLGLYYNLKSNYDFSIEGYYKNLNNLLDYRDGYSFLPTFSTWEEKVTAGKGRAYGVEFMARKQTGKTTGWVGYTLSWADRKFEEIDGGKRFPSKYDNRHKINIVVMHKLSKKVDLSAAWTYSSGNRQTLSLNSYEVAEGWMPGESGSGTQVLDAYTGRNNFQLPAYHRLDLGINVYRPKKSGNLGIWNISIYNVYNRLNPFMVYKAHKTVREWLPPGQDPNGLGPHNKSVPVFKKVGIIPIIPSISYTYKF